MLESAPRGLLLWLGGIIVTAIAGALLLAFLMLPRTPRQLPAEEPGVTYRDRGALRLTQLTGARKPVPLGGEVFDGRIILVLSSVGSEDLSDVAVEFLVVGSDRLRESPTRAVGKQKAESIFHSLPPGEYRWRVAVRRGGGRERIYSPSSVAPTAPHFRVSSPIPVRLGDLTQYAHSGERLPRGGKTLERVVLNVATEGGGASTLVEVEVKPLSMRFNRAGLRALPPGEGRVAAFDLPLDSDSYRWRARARDGNRVTAWRNFGIGAAPDFIVVQAPQPDRESQQVTPDAARLVAQESISGEGGEGASRPNPSVVSAALHLWTLLRPFAFVLAGMGFAGAVLVGVIAIRQHLRRTSQK